jgi:hypothetical protein
VDDTLFDRLPPDSRLHTVRRRFGPAGTVTIAYRLTRPPTGGWARTLELRPGRLRLVYEKFRYPLDDLAGLIRKTSTSRGADETVVDLTGSAAGQRVEVTGTVTGSGPDPAIDFKVRGFNFPIDDGLFDAMPKEKYRLALKKLRAAGRGDFVAEIKQRQDVNLTENTFRITVTDGAFEYTHFPYALTAVRGKVVVFVTSTDSSRPVNPGVNVPDDEVKFFDFEGRHGPALVAFAGENVAVAGGSDRKLTLRIAATDCPVDEKLRAALAAIRLDSVWRTFSPSGSLSCGVEVEITDRNRPAADLPARPRPGR